MKAFLLALIAIGGISWAAHYGLDQLPETATERDGIGNVRLN